jgi:hypothetical protein
MTITPAQFRTDLPEFSDTAKFPDTLISLWIDMATVYVDEERWGGETAALRGTELCAAHLIVLAAREQATADLGAIPGTIRGLLTSKSVGDVSASYDVSSLLSAADAGFWSQTSYGMQFFRLSRLMGAGGIQL